MEAVLHNVLVFLIASARGSLERLMQAEEGSARPGKAEMASSD